MESRVEAIATDWQWLDETVKQAKEKYQARRTQEEELAHEETLTGASLLASFAEHFSHGSKL